MNVDLLTRHLVDSLTKLHSLDELLDQDARLRPNNVRAQQLPRIGVSDQLAKVVGVFHRPAKSDVGITLYGGDVGQASSAQRLFGFAYGGHLRVCEYGVGDGPQVGGAHGVGVDDVVRHGAAFGVGYMLELIRIGDVAKRPNAGHVCAQIFVGDDEAVLVELNAS